MVRLHQPITSSLTLIGMTDITDSHLHQLSNLQVVDLIHCETPIHNSSLVALAEPMDLHLPVSEALPTV